jgi:hypothetical protein
VVIVDDEKQQTPPPEVDAGHGGGGGGGGGGLGNLDGSIGWGLDGGGGASEHGFPGSGQKGDNGTGVLILVRVDRGTANLADALGDLTHDIVDTLQGAGLIVSEVAVADLYTGGALWGSRLNWDPPRNLPDTLRILASSASPPARCPTDTMRSVGATLSGLTVGGVRIFSPPPGAFLTVLIDPGPRPFALAQCPGASVFAGAPYASWANFAGVSLSRAKTRYAFIATPETETADAMRARCLRTPGFPADVLDAIAPSPLAILDPLASDISRYQFGLASRLDLCDSIGSAASVALRAFAEAWVKVLVVQP